MRLYLADLGHNLVTATSDTYPLGVGNLATYAQAHAKSPTPVEVAIFRDPQEFKAAVDTAPPDVVGFSSYSWNHHLALSFANYVKAVNPNIRDAELDHLRQQQQHLADYIDKAQIRLDALRLIVVTPE